MKSQDEPVKNIHNILKEYKLISSAKQIKGSTNE
mgnify:CR=1 FL=1